MATIPLQVSSRRLDTGSVVQYPTGSPIGAALEGVGNELQQVAASIQRKQEQRDAFQEDALRNELDASASNLINEKVTKWEAPDGAGLHDDIVGQINPQTGQSLRAGAFDKLASDYLKRVPASRREQFAADLPAMRLRISGKLAAAQVGMEQDYAKVEVSKIQSNLLNEIIQADPSDKLSIEQFRKRGLDIIEKSPLQPLAKMQQAQLWEESAAETTYQAWLAKDPEAAAKGAAALGMAPAHSGDAVDVVTDKIIGVESGGNPNAKNPRSSASGVGQFLDSTWVQTIRQHRPDIAAGKSAAQLIALKSDRALGREMTKAYQQDNADYLANRGLVTTPGNIYLAHFLGPGGAVSVLKADPNTPVVNIVGQDVVRANPFLAGKTAADTIAWSNKKMGGASGPAGAPDPRFAAIPADRRLLLARQASSQQEQNAAAYTSGLSDYIASLRDGREADREGKYSADALYTSLSTAQASTAQQQIDQARAYGQDKNAIAFASPAEVQSMFAEREAALDTPAGAGFRQGASDLSGLAAVYKARNEALLADPAVYVAQQPAIAAAFKSMAANQQDPQAARAYATATLTEQNRLGVPADKQRILPEQTAADYVARFNDQSGGSQNAATLMRSLEAQWGSNWPKVFGELAATKQLPGTALVVGAMNRPDQARDAEALAAAAKIGTTDLEKAVTSETKKTVSNAVDTALADFNGTLVNNGASGAATYNTFREATYQLALFYARHEDPSEAASRAYAGVLGRKYAFQDTYRVPSEYDAGEVGSGAETILENLSADGLRLPFSGMDDEQTRAVYLRQIQAHGFWITNRDESGLTLMDEAGGAVVGKDGKPLSFTWAALTSNKPSANSRQVPAAEQQPARAMPWQVSPENIPPPAEVRGWDQP
ncbi:hypothetical protein [Mesorhizobium sp.]|uniref:lytic transglycosylase domain-containing protein n=1 Tax=Mesorhizobium sp. TaxID=1871066 RepID=UPI000FE51126|nr:hypothetical protein [Mesorhizobium sp.]RWN59625.1 MAG: lytic transglycosylase domain-containing protein [Mesorhizobium sp.]